MNVGVCIPESHIGTLVARSSYPLNFDWLNAFNYSLDLSTEMRERGSHYEGVILSWHLKMIERLHVRNRAALVDIIIALQLIVVNLEEAMLDCTKESSTFRLIDIAKRIVNNSDSAEAFDTQSYQNSDRREIAFDKVICAIEGIYPYDGILEIKGLKEHSLRSSLFISLPQSF
jgi:hypothetical protein